MPTVLREDGHRLYFYSHEPNEPPHVHIDKAGASAKIWLERCTLASNAGYSARELGAVIQIVRHYRIRLLEAWNDHFGSG